MTVRDVLLGLVEEHGFSGAVRFDRAGRTEVAEASGFGPPAHAPPHKVHTTFPQPTFPNW
jgi:hypothetical protein